MNLISLEVRSLQGVVGALIQLSSSNFVLRPGEMITVKSVDDIAAAIKAWPNWASRPWIVAGRTESVLEPPVYEGPFIADCSGTDYETQMIKLMEQFDWAIYSYFTTYQHELCTILTRSVSLHQTLLEIIPSSRVLGSNTDIAGMASLNKASYYDVGTEGWLAYELAVSRGEESPFLLCRIDAEHLDAYRYNAELEAYEDDPWYHESLIQLGKVAEFPIKSSLRSVVYGVYRVSDIGAYRKIWARVSSNCSIAVATLSADARMDLLEKKLSETKTFDLIGDAHLIGSWAYGQIYGGGADERHAVFCARDPKLTHELWSYVGDAGISRF